MCLFKVSACLSSLLYHTVILLPCPGCISVCFTWTLFSAGVFDYMLCLNKRSDIFCSLNLFDSLHFGSFIHTGLICRQNAPCITPPQVPTIDTWALELDQTAVEECGLVWWIKCSSITWMAECVCIACSMGRNQAGSASVMLWAMLGNLGSWCYFDSDTYLSISIGLPILMKARLFMGTVFPDVCGLCQCDNTACRKAKMVQEWFTEHNNRFEVLTSNVDLQSSICVQTVPIHGGRTSQLTRLKLDLDFCRKFMS